MTVLCRFLGPLALCLLSQPAVADCGLLRRIDQLSPLLDAVVTGKELVARTDLEIAVRRLDAAAIQSSFVRSGRPELVAPVTQYISAVRHLIHTHDSLSRRASIAAGRAFVRSTIAESCAGGPPEANTSVATDGGFSALSLREPTDAQVIQPERSVPISTPFPLAIGVSAIAALIVLVVVLWTGRQRPRVERAERLPSRYQTRLLTGGNEYPCMVIDFSDKGCKITVPKGLPKVREVRIVLDECTLPARIYWRTEFFLGVRVSPGVPQSLLDARGVALKS